MARNIGLNCTKVRSRELSCRQWGAAENRRHSTYPEDGEGWSTNLQDCAGP